MSLSLDRGLYCRSIYLVRDMIYKISRVLFHSVFANIRSLKSQNLVLVWSHSY